jgi:POT family proton-dependent oligopeptide transporter
MVATEEEMRAVPALPDRFGHPRGLTVLAGTELWDRISFHGMQAMLVLYMTGELVKPGRMEHIIGFDAFRHLLESVYGPLTSMALATQTFGWYVAIMTFMPLIGGWLGDKVISRRSGVASGALLMTAGHFCLAFDETFLIALGLLVTGAGMLRGNLKPQIRSLYQAGDRRLAEAFQVYSFVVNFGAFIAPIVTGAVAKYFGWHAGFGVAGFGMLIGLVWYLMGSKDLPPDRKEEPAAATEKRPLSRGEWRNIGGLLLLWPFSVAFWTSQAQIWNVYNVWVRDHIDMTVGGFAVPVPWLQSLDGLMPAVFIPFTIWLWRRQSAAGTEPNYFTKMAIGCVLFALATLLLAGSQTFAGPGAMGFIAIPVLFHVFSNLGAVYFSPVMLAVVAERAPERLRGTMMGVDALATSVASIISGSMGAWYEKVSPTSFWLATATIVGVAGVLLFLIQPLFRRIFVDVPADSSPQLDANAVLAPTG